MHRSTGAAVAALAALAGAANGADCPGYAYWVLVTQGDVAPGVGAMTRFHKLAANGFEGWVVEAETDHPDPGANAVVLRDGAILLREGQLLSAPAGARFASVGSASLTRYHAAWLLSLRGTAGTHDDAAVYVDDNLLLQEGDPAGGFSPGTRYLEFFGAAMNEDNTVLLMTSVDDPLIPGADDRALVALAYDPASGRHTERIVVREGDVLPGQTEPVEDIAIGPGQFGLSENGRTICIVDLAGPGDADSAVYVDDWVLAQQGEPSPLSGRAWGSLETASVAVTDGYAALRAAIDGDPASGVVLATRRDDGYWLIFAQLGGPVPGVPGATLTTLDGPIAVGSYGQTLWYGAWDGGEGIFRDHDEPVILTGETEIGGRLVTGIASGPDRFQADARGYRIIAQVTLEGGASAVVLAEQFTGCRCWADFDCNWTLDWFDFLCFQNEFSLGCCP